MNFIFDKGNLNFRPCDTRVQQTGPLQALQRDSNTTIFNTEKNVLDYKFAFFGIDTFTLWNTRTSGCIRAYLFQSLASLGCC